MTRLEADNELIDLEMNVEIEKKKKDVCLHMIISAQIKLQNNTHHVS